MPGYIDKDALIKTTEEAPFTMSMCVSVEECNGMNRARKLFVEIFKTLPTSDVAPVIHGNWITKEYMYGDPDVGLEDMWVDRLAETTDYYAECSICGKNAGYDAGGDLILSDFCPSCGVKMDGGDSSG